MKFIVLGTSEFTLSCTRALIDSGAEVDALISLPKRLLPLNSVDIYHFAKKKGIPYYELEDINSPRGIRLIKSFRPDYIFSSWPKIIKSRVLGLPKRYCIGTHPTALPFNRGRHPLHWLITLKIPRTKLSFFIMDKGVDTGRVLLQSPFKILAGDTVIDLAEKMNSAAYWGTRELVKRLLKNPGYRGTAQNHRLANYWRKRTAHDITLDPRMPAEVISRIVRSFTLPYPGANLIFEKHVVKITGVSTVKNKAGGQGVERLEQGRILMIKGNKIQIKVEGGIVELTAKDSIPGLLKKAKYIHPPSKYILKWPRELKKKLL